MLKIILYAVLVALLALLIYAATKPDTFALQRSITIAAPPEKLYALIQDMKAFNTWNPFAKKDPAQVVRYEGPASGLGAAYAWEGPVVGKGRMEVTEDLAPTRLAMRLDFVKPMKATHRVDFTIEPQGANSRVTWAMSGAMPYVSKLMTIFYSMDKMAGGDFESGLANLKAIAEAR